MNGDKKNIIFSDDVEITFTPMLLEQKFNIL